MSLDFRTEFVKRMMRNIWKKVMPNSQKHNGDNIVSERRANWMFAAYIGFHMFAPFGEYIAKMCAGFCKL